MTGVMRKRRRQQRDFFAFSQAKRAMAATLILAVLLTTETWSQITFAEPIMNTAASSLQGADAEEMFADGQSERTKLLPPKPCADGTDFCKDEDSYPEELINTIVNSQVSKYPDVMEKYFTEADDLEVEAKTSDEDTYDVFNIEGEKVQAIKACEAVSSTIPRGTIARSVENKWRYIIQASHGRVQHIHITLCKKADEPCRNFEDSPRTDGRTLCKQVFKTRKLFAVDESGKAVIDSFDLPSGCVCHYAPPSSRTLLRQGLEPPRKLCPANRRPFRLRVATKSESRSSGGRRSRKSRRRSTEKQRKSSAISFPEVGNASECPDNEVLCDDDPDYPADDIERLVKREKNILALRKNFWRIFSTNCKERDMNDSNFQLKTGLVNLNEKPLCRTDHRYVFPQKARNKDGEMRFIVNTEKLKQGVTTGTCSRHPPGVRNCKFDGEDGHYPEASVCHQLYTVHNLMVVHNNEVFMDEFEFPGACICLIDVIYFG